MTGPTYDRTAAEAEFRRAMDSAADRAWKEGVEEEALAAMFDLLEAAVAGNRR